jgi:hypothetical protein
VRKNLPRAGIEEKEPTDMLTAISAQGMERPQIFLRKKYKEFEKMHILNTRLDNKIFFSAFAFLFLPCASLMGKN